MQRNSETWPLRRGSRVLTQRLQMCCRFFDAGNLVEVHEVKCLWLTEGSILSCTQGFQKEISMKNLKRVNKPSSTSKYSVPEVMKAELLTARMDFQQEIRERAYEIYCGRDSASATALDDWLKAEVEIKAKYATR
jgi:Protein of unknown function (DUF2934)